MKDHLLYLRDILAAMIAVQAFVEEMDFETFIADDKTASAVIYKLESIGEAAKNVSEEIRQQYPQVPWRQLIGIRDKLIREYFAVDYSVVWKTVENRIPSLQPIIGQILKDLEEETPDGQ